MTPRQKLSWWLRIGKLKIKRHGPEFVPTSVIILAWALAAVLLLTASWLL